MTMTKVRTTIKVNDGLVTSFSRMVWRVLFPRSHPPSSFSVTTPYVGRSIPDEMEYRYAEHPGGSVANIEKFLPERKKNGGSEREGEKERARIRRGREGERGRVIESFAFLENIIDRLELIGAETIGRRSSRSFAFARIHGCGRAVEKPLIGATRRENSTWNLFSQQCACYCSPRFEMYASSSVRVDDSDK